MEGWSRLSPFRLAEECTKLTSINLMFQVANQENDSDVAIAKSLDLQGTGANRARFVDMVKFMNQVDMANDDLGRKVVGLQNLVSFFLVPKTKINKKTVGYARAGGTVQPLALSEDPEELITTLTDIFNQILSVSTTFVSASLPVNAFNRSRSWTTFSWRFSSLMRWAGRTGTVTSRNSGWPGSMTPAEMSI